MKGKKRYVRVWLNFLYSLMLGLLVVPQTIAQETHVDNPFEHATAYIDPDYAAKVKAEAAQTGGILGEQMAKVADYPTAIWLDRNAAISGATEKRGLQAHLDEALAQRQGDTPITVLLVIYNLPNRDCNALASNGELLFAEDGLHRYQTEYIDPIVDILSRPEYRELRIVTIIEPDSLPNLVTNLSAPKCAEADGPGGYRDGIAYAVNALHALPNVYIYLDIAHSGWLGWDNNFNKALQLYNNFVRTLDNGVNSIDGFVSNTANYTPLDEPNLPDPNQNINGQPLRSSRFYEWNLRFDERDFVTDLYRAFVNAGFPESIGMLIDTSRNGWGGPNRPTGASGGTVDQYVNTGRIDRRQHRGNWCNQSGAGIGERPQASPAQHIDAYVWVKPPGESDGISEPTPGGPNDEGKQHDSMCSPTYIASNGYPTGALAHAPHAGHWFPEHFRTLVENAYPPLDDTPIAESGTAEPVEPSGVESDACGFLVDYNIVNTWNTGFQVDLTITNTSAADISGWKLSWTFPKQEMFESGWNADFTPSGSSFSAANAAGHWNGIIRGNGGTVTFGFLGKHQGEVGVPVSFTLNGKVCDSGRQ